MDFFVVNSYEVSTISHSSTNNFATGKGDLGKDVIFHFLVILLTQYCTILNPTFIHLFVCFLFIYFF